VPLQAEEGYLQTSEPRAARQSGHGSPGINMGARARPCCAMLRPVNLGSAFCEHDTTTRCPTSDCNNARSERMCRTSQACLQPLYGSRVVYRPHSLGVRREVADIEHCPQRQAPNLTIYLTMHPHRCERGLHSALHLFAISNAPHIPIWHCGHAAQCSSSVTL
jgi:hypothetical protein